MLQLHAVQTYSLSWTPRWDWLRSVSSVYFPRVLRRCAVTDNTRTVTHSGRACICLTLPFKWQPPPKATAWVDMSEVCVRLPVCVCVQWGVTTVQVHWSRVSVSGSVFPKCICVCLRPLGAIVGDNVSCPLRPHLHHHPSWCHLSWPRTKLSLWEKPACRAPCSESTQPCPAPTHACSASALLALITASLPGLCSHKNMQQQEGMEMLMAPWAITTGVCGYVTAIASEWGCCVGRCCPGTSIH